MKNLRAVALCLCVTVASCGGGSNKPIVESPPAGGGGTPVVTAPAISQQPAAVSVAEGQGASFTVAATGTAPLAYQWQRNGTDIPGATSATYALAQAALADNGAVFRAVVANAAGNATSDNASLTVTASTTPQTLGITTQPSNASVVAGNPAVFRVAGSCTSSPLSVQWQRSAGGAAFADIAGEVFTSYTVTPSIGDNGTQFRAQLSCGGQAATSSSVATLNVVAAATAVLSAVPIAGVRDQAVVSLPGGIVREPSGSFAFIQGSTIRRLSADLSAITVVAGGANNSGSVDGVGTAASFSGPNSITADPAGNLYVSEISTQLIRRIATDGTVTTIAGTRFASGTADGTGAAARFNNPLALAMGPDGNLYVADTGNCSIRQVTPAGVVSTYAGLGGSCGYVNGPASSARFQVVYGVAVGGDGTVYVSDAGNSRVRRIQRSGSVAGAVDTLAGSAAAGSHVDGIGTSAGISYPFGMTVDGGTLYVRDGNGYTGLIRAINLSTAAVTTVTGTIGTAPTGDITGLVDGPRGSAFIGGNDAGIAAVGDGRLVFTDFASSSIRVAASDGTVTTIAHDAWGGSNHPDGTGVLAQLPLRLGSAMALAAAPDGSLVVGEQTTIRRLASDGGIAPLAGLAGVTFNLDGSGSGAQVFDGAQAVAVAADGTVYFSDNYDIRRLNPATRAVASLAGSKTAQGSVDGVGATARFQGVTGLAVGPDGAVYAADGANAAIRRIDAAGNVSTFAGALATPGTADGPRATARLTRPRDLGFAPDGTLWVLDAVSPYASLRRIAPDGSVTTLATTGTALGSSNSRMAVDPAGNVYLCNDFGLFSLDTGTGALTAVIPSSSDGVVVLGSAPRLAYIADAFTATGVKQLVLIENAQLLRATLP